MAKKPTDRTSSAKKSARQRLASTTKDGQKGRLLKRGKIKKPGKIDRDVIDDLKPWGPGRPWDRDKPGGGKPGGQISPITPTLIGELVDSVVKDVQLNTDLDRADWLDTVSGALMGSLTERFPKDFPVKPLAQGEAGAALPIAEASVSSLLKLATARLSEGQEHVIWDDGTNTLLVHAADVKMELDEGIAEVLIPVECREAKAVMRVPFAVGSQKQVTGMIIAAPDRPGGNSLIGAVWGEALIAFAYESLISTVESLSRASGHDRQKRPLVPRSLSAFRGGMVVQSQGRFDYAEGDK